MRETLDVSQAFEAVDNEITIRAYRMLYTILNIIIAAIDCEVH